MNRRNFIKAIAGVVGVAVCPTIPGALPAPAPPLPPAPRTEWYAWAEQGFAVLDNRRILLGEFDCDGEVKHG